MNLAKNHDLTEFSFHQKNLVHSGQQMLTKVALVKNVVTQHHTAARRVVASLSCFAYHTMLRLLPNRGLVGSQGLKRTMKKNTPNVDACAEIHFQMKISDLSASTRPKKARFSSNSIFKFYLQLQSPRFFCQIVQFQVIIINGWLKYIYRIF